MSTSSALLLVLDLAGTFVFALNGALTAIRAARLDIVGVVALGMFTAMGGGIVRDVLIGSLPPATFSDWRSSMRRVVSATTRLSSMKSTVAPGTGSGCT